jgi:hypothetical protein
MVRAAALGVIDFTSADPNDKFWRIKYRLLLREMRRQDDQRVLEYAQKHWAAYISHGNLTPESFAKTQKDAADTFLNLQKTVFPWLEIKPAEEVKPDSKTSKIDTETQQLVSRFKVWRQNAQPDGESKQ